MITDLVSSAQVENHIWVVRATPRATPIRFHFQMQSDLDEIVREELRHQQLWMKEYFNTQWHRPNTNNSPCQTNPITSPATQSSSS